MTDFLDEKRREITDRLKELKPLVDEYNRLEAAASALAGVGGSARAPPRPPLRAAADRDARAARSTAQSAATAAAPKAGAQKPDAPRGRRRAGRRKGSGTRAAEALSFVQGQPGITIPELAAKMGIKQNYLYRVLPGLEQENKVSEAGPRLAPQGLVCASTRPRARRASTLQRQAARLR